MLNTKSKDGSSPRRFRRYSAGVNQHLSQLRREMTPAEQLLWTWLRDRKLDGVKFRRQYPISSFVLDFYAPELRLAVEVDGDVHELPEQLAYDKRRQAWLEATGLRVVRFSNGRVINELSDVLEEISAVISDLRARRDGEADELHEPG